MRRSAYRCNRGIAPLKREPSPAIKDTHLGHPRRLNHCRFLTTQDGLSHSAGLITESASVVPLNCWYTVDEAYFMFSFWLDSSSGFRSLLWSSSITLRQITLGRSSSDKWPACRGDLYLTTRRTHKGQTSMPRRDSNPQYRKACSRIRTP